MKTIETLIKLHRRTLDETRRELVREENFKEEVEGILDQHRIEMRSEGEIASQSVEAAFFYGNYINRALKKEDKIIGVIDQQEAKIQNLAESIMDLFGEVKRYEIINDIKKKEEEAVEARRDQIELDEIATTAFIRSKEH